MTRPPSASSLPPFAALLVVFVSACALPEGPSRGRVQICVIESNTAPLSPLEPHVINRAVVVGDADRELPEDPECAREAKRVDIELADASGARLRVAVVEFDREGASIGSFTEVPAGALLSGTIDPRGRFDARMILSDDDGVVVAAQQNRDSDDATAVPTGYAYSVAGAFGETCGSYDVTATRFFSEPNVIAVEPGDTAEAVFAEHTLAATNASSVRYTANGRCTDVRSGDFAHWIVLRTVI